MTTKTKADAPTEADLAAAAEAFDLHAWLDGLAPAEAIYEKAISAGLPTPIKLQARTAEWREALNPDDKLEDDEVDLLYIAGHIIEPEALGVEELRTLFAARPQHRGPLRAACWQLDNEPEVSPLFLRALSA